MGVEDKREIFRRRLPDLPNGEKWFGDESNGFSESQLLKPKVSLEILSLGQINECVFNRSQAYPGKQTNDNS